MSQPEWECIGQLGDANPIDHGGYWILRDKTGVYPEEGEYLDSPTEDDNDDNDEVREYVAHRFILDRCTFIDGVLSDNKYHPKHSAWWAKTEEERESRPQDTTYLKNISDQFEMMADELAEKFCSEDPLERAWAYREVGMYHGFDNLDGDPLRMSRKEAEERYADPKFLVIE